LLRRILSLVVLFSLVGVGATVAAIYIQQRLIRSRAESLLSDIRGLELRKSNWNDAQKVFTHWGTSGHYNGLCTASNCDYRVEVGDFFLIHPRSIRVAPLAHRAYKLLGVRVTLIRASVYVRDGLVWGKSFSLFLDVPAETGPNASFAGYGYTLVGRAESVARFPLDASLPQLALHPDYTVTTPGGCTGCRAAIVEFTPFADPSDVARLMDFNLTCLTSRKPCRTREDVMPTAWKQYLAEEPVDVVPAARTN
jgi:hypothetical protein